MLKTYIYGTQMELITSKNVEKQNEGHYYYWKDSNGGKISIRLSNSGSKSVKVKTIKLYNKLLGKNLDNTLYDGLLEVVVDKKRKDKNVVSLKIKKPSRDFNSAPFKIVVDFENGKKMVSPDIHVFSKKYKSKKRSTAPVERTKKEKVVKKRKRIVKSIKTQTIEESQPKSINEAMNKIKWLQSEMQSMKKKMEENNRLLCLLSEKKNEPSEGVDDIPMINKLFSEETKMTEDVDWNLWWAKGL